MLILWWEVMCRVWGAYRLSWCLCLDVSACTDLRVEYQELPRPPQEVFTQSHGVFAYRFQTNSNCIHTLVFLTVEWQHCMWKLFMQDKGLFFFFFFFPPPPKNSLVAKLFGPKCITRWLFLVVRHILSGVISDSSVIWVSNIFSYLFPPVESNCSEPRRFHSWGVRVWCVDVRGDVSVFLPPVLPTLLHFCWALVAGINVENDDKQ